MTKPHLQQTLFFLFSLILAPAFAQMTDEATYTTNGLQRLKLPISGEIWYYADNAGQQIHLFKADHSPLKVIDYPKETNNKVSLASMNLPVSQTTFKADNLLEFVWLFQDTISRRERIKILNERGDSIFFFPFNQIKIEVNELLGSPTKLFVEYGQYYTDGSDLKTSIYSLPSMVLDTTFTNASDMRRQKFSYAGEKFYFKNRAANLLEIYNPNYTRWKPAIKIHNTRNELNYPDPIFFADDKTFNADTLVECMFTYWHANGWPLIKIVSEKNINIKIAYANSYSYLILDKKVGYPDKLFSAYQANGSSMTAKYEVFSLPQMIKEVTPYKLAVFRILLKQFGAKYMTVGDDSIYLYDMLHHPWKTIPISRTSNFGINSPLVCDSIVNSDSLLEVIWIERDVRNNIPASSNLRITKENGDNLFRIPDVYHFEISQLDELPTKLITKMANGTTKVWRFTPRTAIQDPSVFNDLDVQISPNPYVSFFTIHQNNSDTPLSIRLFNSIGQLVFTGQNIQNKAIITPPLNLSKGIYLLEISSKEKRITQRLVKL